MAFPLPISRLLLRSPNLISAENHSLGSKKMLLMESAIWKGISGERKIITTLLSLDSLWNSGLISVISEFWFHGLMPGYQLWAFCIFRPFWSIYFPGSSIINREPLLDSQQSLRGMKMRTKSQWLFPRIVNTHTYAWACTCRHAHTHTPQALILNPSIDRCIWADYRGLGEPFKELQVQKRHHRKGQALSKVNRGISGEYQAQNFSPTCPSPPPCTPKDLMQDTREWWCFYSAEVSRGESLGVEARDDSSACSDFYIPQAGWSIRGFFGACRHHPFFHIQGIAPFSHAL